MREKHVLPMMTPATDDKKSSRGAVPLLGLTTGLGRFDETSSSIGGNPETQACTGARNQNVRYRTRGVHPGQLFVEGNDHQIDGFLGQNHDPRENSRRFGAPPPHKRAGQGSRDYEMGRKRRRDAQPNLAGEIEGSLNRLEKP